MENIAILMGGSSKEKEISLKSAKTIYNHIDQNKYNAYTVMHINNHDFQVIINKEKYPIDKRTFSFILDKTNIQFHKVFMMIHGDPGENGKLCAFFDKKNIPYTSCNQKVSELTFHKFQCNNYLRTIGYNVPSSQMASSNYNIKFPCIIKPSCSGSSFGISKASNFEELQKAIIKAEKYDPEVIIEQFIIGREVTCAVFKDSNTIKTLPITEIISENEIFDYDAKYNGKSIERTPAHINTILQEKIERISKELYRVLEISGIVRIDFMIKKQTPYIIEINTVPGFSEESIVPQMLKHANIDIQHFITTELRRLDG